jgi:uncharacterized protein (TIGR03435 family)
VAFASTLAFGVSNMPLKAQSSTSRTPSVSLISTPEWQIAAGSKKEFAVASIRRSEPGTFLRPNMVLNNEDTPVPPGGRFSGDFPLEIYIEFAYKIMPTREQEDAMLAHLPKWVSTDHFVIQAEAEGNPTKDQVRLMMQSLLADRFKLVVHFETKVVPVFGLILDRPGRTGPRIRPHSEGPACDAAIAPAADRSSSSVPPGEFVPSCGRVQAIYGPDHTVVLGARDISLEHLAGYLPDFEDTGRPLVDQTGLGGTFDFSLNWLPESNITPQAGASESIDAQGPSFLTALRDQLGMKLKPAAAPIPLLVVDHVEQLSPN